MVFATNLNLVVLINVLWKINSNRISNLEYSFYNKKSRSSRKFANDISRWIKCWTRVTNKCCMNVSMDKYSKRVINPRQLYNIQHSHQLTIYYFHLIIVFATAS